MDMSIIRSDASMSLSPDVALAGDHPLALELSSLQEAVHHFQSEAHRATVQLRHQSLEHTSILQHLHALENENSYLRAELRVHRTAGPPGAHRNTLQVQELTLALRRLSDKLDLTEKVLLERNEELVAAQSRRNAARKTEYAVEAVNRLRSELAASHERERELMNRVKSSEEQRKMSDLVVEEYANLVRSLEGRPSLGSRADGKTTGDYSRNSLDGLMNARQGLHKLLQDSNHDSEKLHAEINRLHDALELARADLEAERASAQEDKLRLAQAQLELHQLKCDDQAAAKMVARYMKFSQSSSDVLHGAIDNLKARQEALITSYELRLQQAETRISSEIRQSEMLRRVLDELTEDISRESYGRRREIVLRLALLAREQMLSERLRRWLLRSRELLQKATLEGDEKSLKGAFERTLDDASCVLSSIDGPSDSESESLSSAARVFVAYSTVRALQADLQRETDRRLYFEHQLATSRPQQVKDLKSDGETSSVGTTSSLPRPLSGASGSVAPSLTLNNVDRKRVELPVAQATTDLADKMGHSGMTELSSSSTVTAVSSQAGTSATLTSCPAPALHVPSMDGDQVEHVPKELSTTPSESNGVTTSGVPNAPWSQFPLASLGEPNQRHPIALNVLDGKEGSDSEADYVTDRKAETPPNGVEIGASSSTVPLPRDVGSTGSLEIKENDPASTEKVITTSPKVATSNQPVGDSAGGVPVSPPMSSSGSLPLSISQNERFKESLPDQEPQGPLLHRPVESPEQDNPDVMSLLSGLAATNERYVDLQRSFRDCHLALQELGQVSKGLPKSDVLHIAIDRLNDYCEDARVELEIRVADEERIAKGFQTLLCVPGALSDEVNEHEVMQQIRSFIDGSDPTVRRTEGTHKHKLDDLEHDIASIKRALHGSASPLLSPDEFQEQSNASKASSWTAWTGSILGPPRTSSPTPSFGAVMTSPRLRHSSSTRSLRAETSNVPSPFASLGLRIPMPSSLPRRPERPPSPIVQRGSARPSTIFGLGLHRRLGQAIPRSSLGFKYSTVSKSTPRADEDDLDSDVE